jgi:hypothetical protein
VEEAARPSAAEGAAGGAQADRCALRGGAGRTWQVAGGALYVVMIGLGAATLYVAVGDRLWSWIAAGAYCAYAPLAGLVFAVRGCGHGARAAPRASGAAAGDSQARGFWLHLPLVVPAWILPPAAAGVSVAAGFAWPVAILGSLFALESVVLLPLVARHYICPHCPQRGTCPWMRGGGRRA